MDKQKKRNTKGIMTKAKEQSNSINAPLTPLIKWPGGKSDELELIKPMIPDYERYIEPFIGGGALYFDTAPQKGIINDISTDLTQLYRHISNEQLRNKLKIELEAIVDFWELLTEEHIKIGTTFSTAVKEQKDPDWLKFKASCKETIIETKRIKHWLQPEFSVYKESLIKRLEDGLTLKAKLGRKLSKTGVLTDENLSCLATTGLKSGFYTHIREAMNKKWGDTTRGTAYYYFIREFCYASMFRYNSEGGFNIPYGGMAYNTKDLRKKVNYMLSEPVIKLLSNTSIRTGDFETAIQQKEITKTDFIFLDPPYDTEFSAYNGVEFDAKEQRRLRKWLGNTKGQFLLVIKSSPLIEELYIGNGFNVVDFAKSYTYNMKGRNDRNVMHLAITNYKLPQ